MYDFTTLRNRTNVGAPKWDNMYAQKQDIPPGVIPFSVADMEFLNPPEIIADMKAYLDNHILGYTLPTKAYYSAVCGWMKRIHNWEVKPEEIVITPGVVPALFYAVRVLTEPGDGVIVMPPVYGPFFAAAERTGRESVHCPLIATEEGYDIDFPLLEELCAKKSNKLLIFCNPHNPVGRVWTREELARVGKICKDNQVVLVSDEIHCDIIMPGYKHVPMGIFPEFADNLVVCTAPSKTFNLATTQTSNLMIPNPKLRELFVRYKEEYCVESQNALGFVACMSAYNKGEAWRQEMIAAVYGNYQYLKNFLQEKLPYIGLAEMMSTYLAWLDCRALQLSGDELEKLMTEYDLYMNPGTFFGDIGEGFLRMNLACPKLCLEEALARFENALRSLKQK